MDILKNLQGNSNNKQSPSSFLADFGQNKFDDKSIRKEFKEVIKEHYTSFPKNKDVPAQVNSAKNSFNSQGNTERSEFLVHESNHIVQQKNTLSNEVNQKIGSGDLADKTDIEIKKEDSNFEGLEELGWQELISLDAAELNDQLKWSLNSLTFINSINPDAFNTQSVGNFENEVDAVNDEMLQQLTSAGIDLAEGEVEGLSIEASAVQYLQSQRDDNQSNDQNLAEERGVYNLTNNAVISQEYQHHELDSKAVLGQEQLNRASSSFAQQEVLDVRSSSDDLQQPLTAEVASENSIEQGAQLQSDVVAKNFVTTNISSFVQSNIVNSQNVEQGENESQEDQLVMNEVSIIEESGDGYNEEQNFDDKNDSQDNSGHLQQSGDLNHQLDSNKNDLNLNFANALKAYGANVAKNDSPPEIPVTEQIHIKLDQAVEKGDSKITVQLSPEHLGKIEIHLDMQDKAVNNIRISVEKQETLEMLQKEQRTLLSSIIEVTKSDEPSLSFDLKQNHHNFMQDEKEQRENLARLLQEGSDNGEIYDKQREISLIEGYVNYSNIPGGVNIQV